MKKNHSHFLIAVLLTILIGSRYTTANFLFLFATAIIKKLGTCNTPLERYFQYLPKGILQAPKFLKIQLVKQLQSWWSKEPQRQNNCGSFFHSFLLVWVGLQAQCKVKEVNIVDRRWRSKKDSPNHTCVERPLLRNAD